VVMEQLGFTRLKRPEGMHMIVVPWLMTGRWRRHLTHGTDGYAGLDDKEVWDISLQYKPVLIYFCLPFRSENPKFEKLQELLVQIQRVVLEQRLPAVCLRRSRAQMMTRLQNSGAGGCGSTESVVPGYYEN
jgi:hypothetical protein